MAAEKSTSEPNESLSEKSSSGEKETTKPAVRRTRGTSAVKAITKTVVTRAKKSAVAADAKKNNAKQKGKDAEDPEVNKAGESGPSDSKSALNDESPKKKTHCNGSKEGSEYTGDSSTNDEKTPDDDSSLVLDSTLDESDLTKDEKDNDGSASSSDVLCVDSLGGTLDSSAAEALDDKDCAVVVDEAEEKEESVYVDAEETFVAKDAGAEEGGDKDVALDIVLDDEVAASEGTADTTDEAKTKPLEKEETETNPSKTPSPKESSEVEKSGTPKFSPAKVVASSPKGSGNDSSKNSSKAATKSVPEKQGKSPDMGQAEKDLGEKVKRITPSDKTLWVSSLSNKTRAADLKALFTKCGKVSTAKILTNSKTPGTRCYGLVTMFSSKDALACIEHLHHTELHGRVISVEKTRLSIKKQITAGSKASVTESDKSKSDKVPEKKVETPSPEKRKLEEKDKDVKDSKSTSDKKSDKPEHSTESKAKMTKDEEKKTGGAKSDSKLSKSTHRSLSRRGRDGSKTRDVSSKSKDRDVLSKERGDRSRKRVRSRERTISSRARSKSSPGKNAASKDRSKSHNRTSETQHVSRARRRSRSPFDRGVHRYPFNRSRSPTQRGRFLKDRYDNPIRNYGRARFESDFKSSFDVDRDREMQRKNRQETIRIERERERLKAEREELEREKSRILRLEKEHQRLERMKLESEMEELKKYSMLLSMTKTQSSKRSVEREPVWDDRKRSRIDERASVSRRESRHDSEQTSASRYYDSSSRRLDRPTYHSGITDEVVDRPPTWNSSVHQDQSKYGTSPVVPGIWARMDVPPPPIPQQQRWAPMDQTRVQHPGPMSHQPPPAPMAPPPNQVVMFVGNNPNSSSNMPGQYPSNNRFSSNNSRRF